MPEPPRDDAAPRVAAPSAVCVTEAYPAVTPDDDPLILLVESDITFISNANVYHKLICGSLILTKMAETISVLD